MWYSKTKDLFKALGVEINVYQQEGTWAGWHYSYDVGEGWVVCKVTDACATEKEALGKVVETVSNILTDNTRLMKAVKEAGYKVNGFVVH